jgi:alpha-tubulin suppressor-like RCC1 family protein
MAAGTRRVRTALAMGLALAAVPWACGDLVDPQHGLEYDVVLVAPDTVPMGAEVLARVQVTDRAGQSIRGLRVSWQVTRPHLARLTPFGPEAGADERELRLLARGSGEAFVEATVEGTPGRGQKVALASMWGVAQGVRIATAGTGPREILLLLGQDSTVHAELRDIHGQYVAQAGEVEFIVEGSGLYLFAESPVGTVRVNAGSLESGRIIATAPLCAGVCTDTVEVRVIQIPATLETQELHPMSGFGNRVELTALVTDTRGERVYDPPVEWLLADAADTAVVTLEGNVATARGNGSAAVVARLGELADTTTVQVWQAVSRVGVDGPEIRELGQGALDTVRVTAFDYGDPSPHVVVRPYQATASSSSPATVDVAPAGDGIELQAKTPGDAVIMIDVEGVMAQLLVRVNPVLTQLEVRLGRDTLHYVSARTTAEGWGLVGDQWIRVYPVFSSSDPTVAYVEADGVVTALGSGSAWIRAQAGGQVDSARLTVHQIAVSLAVRPASALVARDGSIPFTAEAYDSAGFPIPSFEGTWESSDPSILDIDAQGVATAKALGSVTVTAALGPYRAYANGTVIRPVVDAAIGSGHACFILEGGALHCLGDNDHGELGDGTTLARSAPVPAATPLAFAGVAAGYRFTCGITLGGDTYCWGMGQYGQLGQGTTDDSAVPVRVQGDPGFVQVVAAGSFACGRTAEGAAYCWGQNDAGQLGLGHRDPVAVPAPAAGGHRFETLAAGVDGACAVTTDGDAYCWGYLPDVGDRLEPTRITANTAFRAISGTGCAIAQDGTLHCRDGLTMAARPGAPLYRNIAGASNFHCAEAVDDGVYCFGYNGSGQLGTGDYTHRPEPVRALVEQPATLVRTGWNAACAGNAGGGLTCWGRLDTSGWTLYTPYPTPLIHP